MIACLSDHVIVCVIRPDNFQERFRTNPIMSGMLYYDIAFCLNYVWYSNFFSNIDHTVFLMIIAVIYHITRMLQHAVKFMNLKFMKKNYSKVNGVLCDFEAWLITTKFTIFC